MDDEATKLLREIRDLITAGNAQEANWLTEMRELQQEGVQYNRKVWKLTLVAVVAIIILPIAAFGVAFAVGYFFEPKPPEAIQAPV